MRFTYFRDLNIAETHKKKQKSKEQLIKKIIIK